MAQEPSQNLGITDNTNSFNYNVQVVTNNDNVINLNAEKPDDDNLIREWLSPLKPHQRHQDVRADRLDRVGNWFLETSDFRRWSNGEGGALEQVLFCSGGPGVGKTYLSSLVIDSLCDQAGEKDLAVAWIYCDFLDHQAQSATALLGTILEQLMGVGEIPENVRQTFRTLFPYRGLRLPDIVGMLKTTVASLPAVYICVDALDESTPKSRQELLESLGDIVLGSPCTRVLFTGRSHVEEEVKKYFARATVIPVSPAGDDIRGYLGARLDRDPEPHAMDDDLRRDIMRIIPEMISEVFLLVSLNIDAILGEVTIYKRRKKLEEMRKGKGLGDAYTATLTRIKSQSGSRSRLGMEALMWISHSERPLKTLELCQALGVERGDTDLNTGNMPAIETVLRCSLGLVTVEASSSTVRLVHFTLQEHLSHASSLFHSPHSMMAEICLTFLSFQWVRDLSTALYRPPGKAPFVGYASCYWGTHARKDLSEGVKLLALNLLDGYDKHISSKLLLIHQSDWWWHRSWLPGGDAPKGFTGLHGAAYLGIVDITGALLKMKEWDLNATDVEGNTALSWAAQKGHNDTVEMLLAQRGVDPDTTNAGGRTPLLSAAACGNGGVVKMLLQQVDVNPNTANEDGQTPLCLAVQGGHERVVEMLLERVDVNPNTADKYGQRPLYIAALKGRERVVNMLLGRADVNPNAGDKHGQTPLFIAAYKRHEGIVKMLLEQADANPNTVDNYGRTPLFMAAWKGSEGVANMLLERNDVSPSIADGHGRTPLYEAACEGHEGVVKMLLERADADPNIADDNGQTPLFRAAHEGHEEVVEILLERAHVNPNAVNEQGLTPLFIAARKGREGVVKMLLKRNDVSPSIADEYGQTPLFRAACEGHEEIVKTLLERADINANTSNKYGQTPLFGAACGGHEGVLKILLERGGVNPNAANQYGQTPLFVAASKGHEGVVKMLLEQVHLNPNTADDSGEVPLSTAACEGYEGVVKMLLERADIDPNTTNKYGHTPLLIAAWKGHGGVVKMLLEQVHLNPNTVDNDGRTPLFIDAWKGCEGVVKMLLEREDVDPSAANKHNLTPLIGAARSGHRGVVKMLLERGDVDPSTANFMAKRRSPEPPASDTKES